MFLKKQPKEHWALGVPKELVVVKEFRLFGVFVVSLCKVTKCHPSSLKPVWVARIDMDNKNRSWMVMWNKTHLPGPSLVTMYSYNNTRACVLGTVERSPTHKDNDQREFETILRCLGRNHFR